MRWRNTTILLVLLTLQPVNLLHTEKTGSAPPILSKSLQYLKTNNNYVNIGKMNGIKIDLRYASKNNFMGENLYGDFNICYLHRIAAQKLSRAVKLLQKRKPNWKLLIFDALRPRSVQHKLWQRVKGSNKQAYVANPYRGSIHNFGFAIDLTLIDERGQELDMGTEFDTFSRLSEPRREKYFLRRGKLKKIHIKNRLILRRVMVDAGFRQLPNEWWHFDALPGKIVRKRFRIVE